MNEEAVRKILAKTGVFITNSHVIYTSGRHGSNYINKEAIYANSEETLMLCRAIAEYFAKHGIQFVIGPETGGKTLAFLVAYQLVDISSHEVVALAANKVDGDTSFSLDEYYQEQIFGKRILVVDDVLTTGGSVKKVIEMVNKVGGQMVGLGVLFNRGNVKPADVGNVPEFFALMNISLDSWDELECPLCAKNMPINTEVGQGKRLFLKKTPL